MDKSISSSSNLQTVILGGEKVTHADFARWSGIHKLHVVYGSTECSVVSNIVSVASPGAAAEIVRPCGNEVQIGPAIGCLNWVVNPNDQNQLAGLGCVGELFIEGPTLADGYLGLEMTQEAFIDNPIWLQRHGRQGRTYKTGDLVRYDSYGNLQYIGRKDSQIKVNGQHIELEEIERRILDCLTSETPVTVDIIQSTGSQQSPMLAAFIANGKADIEISPENELRSMLLDRLPRHMVPQVYFAVRRIPMNTSGKVNRERLRQIGASFSIQQLALGQTQTPKRAPSNEVEIILQQVWAQVLGFPPSSVGVEDSFFDLGGDSISAMQVASAARSKNVHISTKDILKARTISGLAIRTKPVPDQHKLTDVSENHTFGLTPIQELYLRREPSGKKAFDQSFLFEVRMPISQEQIQVALDVLVQRHEMLRARFIRGDTVGWAQCICESVNSRVNVRIASCGEEVQLSTFLRESRSSLDIEHGPMMAALLCQYVDKQLLFLTCHHLVVDLVSWRVIVEELEVLLTGGSLPAPPATSYQAWQMTEAAYLNKQRRFRPDPAIAGNLEYWTDDQSRLLHSDLISSGFDLDERITSALLSRCNDTFQTRPVELMLAGLAYAFSIAFPDRGLPTVYNETHGRTAWDQSIDLSRTVGWFTSMFGIELPSSSGRTIEKIICGVKDRIRDAHRTHKTWSSFASHFASAKMAQSFADALPMEVLFNYLGLYQQFERKQALLKPRTLPHDPLATPYTVPFSLFTITFAINDGRSRVRFDFNSRYNHQEGIQRWILEYEKILSALPEIIPALAPRWTKSDFPLAFASNEDVSHFQAQLVPVLARQNLALDDVEDVFPCSGLQQGILISQKKDPGAYWIGLIFEVVPSPAARSEPINIQRLQQAWQSVVRRHSLLRAIIIEQASGGSKPVHVVLKDPVPNVKVFSANVDEAYVTRTLFQSLGAPSTLPYDQLQHHLSICQLQGGKIFILLHINHVIADAMALSLLCRDVQNAYDGLNFASAPSFCDFVSHLSTQESQTAREFWRQYLEGVMPCYFPVLTGEIVPPDDGQNSITVEPVDSRALQEFCRATEVTPAVVARSVWAIILGRYTSTSTPCFGTLVSGRDVRMDDADAEEIFGPLISVLACRADMGRRQSVSQFAQSMQADYATCLSYQNVSLTELQDISSPGKGALFNTIVNVQGSREPPTSDATIKLLLREGTDPTEVSHHLFGSICACRCALAATPTDRVLSCLITRPFYTFVEIH
jgi:aryl carrier-like protein